MNSSLYGATAEQADPQDQPAGTGGIAQATPQPAPLSATEIAELDVCEGMIQRGLQTFIEVGMALMTIREGKLYRAEYGTFEEYLQWRWEITIRQGQRLMIGAEIAQNLKDGAGTWFRMPASESQIRPLAGLPPSEQRAIWTEAVQTAPNGKVTGKHVAEVVRARRDFELLKNHAHRGDQPDHNPIANETPEQRRRFLAEAALVALKSLAQLPAVSVEDADLQEAIEIVERQIPLCDRLDEMQRARAEAQRG